MKIEKDLDVIRKHGKARMDNNFRFRSFLKFQDEERIDEIVHGIYKDVESQIDCTECANCCSVLETSFRKDALRSVMDFQNIDYDKFIARHTKTQDPERSDRVTLKSTPCHFLKDKKCTIYSVRPEECRSYPYLHKDDFISRLFSVIDNYEICPIVYNVYEQLKRRMKFR